MGLNVEGLYERYGPMVLRRCRQLLRDEDQALDAMQDVFVLLLRNHSRLDDSAPSSLLLRMATNVCLNKIRTSKRRPEDPDEALLLEIATSEDLEDRSLARLLLRGIFRSEPDSTRNMAVMHLLDGMTHEEVAREVGLSVSGVRKRLRTLRNRLSTAEGF